jgi:hypothetical protein
MSSVSRAWSDNLSGWSLEEVLRWDAENRAWNKLLRERSAALVNTRLAKAITMEEYAASRQVGHDDAAECKRRGAIISESIMNLRGSALLKQRHQLSHSSE